jgi:hypothetical protein
VRFKEAGEFRRIRYQDPESGEIYEFLTTEFHLSPGIIAQLYRLRWDIEKFFDACENPELLTWWCLKMSAFFHEGTRTA